MIFSRYGYLLLGAALFVLTPSADAQEFDWHRFYPLEAGDTWVYKSCSTFDEGPCTGAYLWQRTVVGDTLVDGVVYAVVERGNLGTTNPRRCAERLSETGEVEWLGGSGCRPPGALGLNLRDPVGAEAYPFEDVGIGGESYEPDSMLFFYDHMYSAYVHNVTFASDIGFISDFYDFMGPGDVGYTILQYAEVDGVVYGTHPVANEAEAVPTAFALGAVYPNPFRTTLTLVLSLPEAETVTLEAFDVLGRRVLDRDLGVQPAGETRQTVSGAMLPPGVYFVRATTASGQSATRRIVRVE